MIDQALGAERAVKLVRPDRIHDPSNFYAEPQALVALQHPHVVQVHDAGRLPDGRVYIAMEYLPDGSVEDHYRGAVVPVAEALRIVGDACRGIEYAHSQNYIHRDVKPANLLLRGGVTKVSDFGLATRTTGVGVASPYGYVSHCAPEVIEPGLTTVKTGVYALGMTLYRLLNGDALLPDPAALGMALDEAIVAGRFPDRSAFRDHVPEPVRRAVRAAIAHDPDRRTPSAADLRHALERVSPAVSFVEVPALTVRSWQGESPTHVWEAAIDKSGSEYVFQIRKGPKGGRLRRVSADEGSFPTSAAARRHARGVLHRLGRHC